MRPVWHGCTGIFAQREVPPVVQRACRSYRYSQTVDRGTVKVAREALSGSEQLKLVARMSLRRPFDDGGVNEASWEVQS